jgi:6-pyruvoyl tetrahydropterin synthase-like protein
MRTYCFRSCISISHSSDYNREHAHIHTVEAAAYVRYDDTQPDLVKFEDAERLIDSCLEPYQESYLNELEGFEEDVSIEHLGETLFYVLDRCLTENRMYIDRFEISETPLRTYMITRRI